MLRDEQGAWLPVYPNPQSSAMYGNCRPDKLMALCRPPLHPYWRAAVPGRQSTGMKTMLLYAFRVTGGLSSPDL